MKYISIALNENDEILARNKTKCEGVKFSKNLFVLTREKARSIIY